LPHPAGVTFHGTAGPGLTVFSIGLCCDARGLAEGPVETGPRLGAGVTLGGHATVIGPVTIGDGVTVAYNCAVLTDVPSGRLVVSNANRMRVERADIGEEARA
jgi:serine acetyltransferase